MARAVQVFKDNAIERARLEAEALANRSQTEIERERAAAERAKAAEEQAEVVRRLGGGLEESGERRLDRPTGRGLLVDLRADPRRFQRSDREAEDHHSDGRRRRGRDRDGREGDFLGLRRPGAPHRTAGGESRADRGDAHRNHRGGEEVRRRHQPCAAGGDQRRRGRQAERRRGASGGRCDERDRQVLAADQPDHRRDRRDRLPDQSARPQRRRRGGARRRRGSRIRGRRLGSSGARATLGASRKGDQGADLRLGRPG